MKCGGVVAMLLLGTGCGTITSQVHIDKASRAVAQARADDGAHKAPYAFHTAVESLHQARVAYGYSHFAQAWELADRAKTYANQAQMAPTVQPGACLGEP